MRYADKPLILKENRVERLYRGGAYLDEWQGLENGGDGFNSEEFIVSTVPYIGPGDPKNQGISLAEVNGQEVSLSEMICMEEKAFLGSGYEGKTCGHLGVLARVGDSVQHLILQCHPTDEFAAKHLNTPFGKTEAWYILNLRGREGCCYAGLKENATKAGFINAFQAGDSKAMVDMMHRIVFHKGDMILIPAGMLHAMGENVTFLEFHQPCDYTLRFEMNYFGKEISPKELHCGLGEDLLFEAVNFKTFTREEIDRLVKKIPSPKYHRTGGSVECILSHEDNPCFRVDRITPEGLMTFRQSEESHCIMIAAKGNIRLRTKDGSAKEAVLRQGRGAVLPAMAGTIFMEGETEGTQLLIGYPYEQKKGGACGLFI